MTDSFRGFCTLLWKEILRYLKVASQTILSPVINAGLYMLIFGVSLGPYIQKEGYLEFLIPGLLAMASLNNALQNAASSIIISKFHGDLQDLRVVPLKPFQITAAYAIAGWTRALVCGAAVYIIGLLMLWVTKGNLMPLANIFSLFYFVSIGALFFGSLGIWAGFWANSFDQINVVTQFVVLPLIYLGGVFYSLDVLPGIWQKIALANPLVYLINGIRWSFLGVSDIGIEKCIVASLVFLIVAFSIAWREVRKGDYTRF